MAKCVGSVNQWTPKKIELENPEFIVECARDGENLLGVRLEYVFKRLLDVASDYLQIKQSTCFDDYKLDCSQVQDSMVTKLEELYSEISSVIKCISSSKLISSTKHRYFIFFSYGTIDRLQQVVQNVGRLSELDQKLFYEEHRKLMKSEESITIHCLTSIWTAIIDIIKGFCEQAQTVFDQEQQQQESQNYDFIGQLEFSTAKFQYAKMFLMDLTITSWIRFNRLVKYEDLADGLPFLCPCHCKTYFQTLRVASNDGEDISILEDILSCIIDYQSKPSMLTYSARRQGIVPYEPCYAQSDSITLAYFIIWHLYSLSRIVKNDQRPIIANCCGIFGQSIDKAWEQFIPTSPSNNTYRLSPHQEERLKLMFVMLNHWCEKNSSDKISIIMKMFSFFEDNWNLFGENYFDKPGFTIGRLTTFQLFTKLINEVVPLYSSDGQAASIDRELTKEEKCLNDVWNKLLTRVQPKPVQPVQQQCSKE